MTGEVDLEGWSVGVVIPARDEADRIEPCVRSVLRALDASSAQRRSTVVVVADGCDDDTARRARRALGARGLVLERRFASVGRARRAGARALAWWARLRGLRPARVWLANTDADSEVPESWVRDHLDLADDGATAVAGTVRLRPGDGVSVDLARRFRAAYEGDSGGSHPHVHGTNLGVRGDAYLDVGGWCAAPLGEDHRLWKRLRQRGWATVATVGSTVVTSARTRGRARGGFADDLRRLSEQAG